MNCPEPCLEWWEYSETYGPITYDEVENCFVVDSIEDINTFAVND